MDQNGSRIQMGDFERRVIDSTPYKPFSWLRFIDDIEMKWTLGIESKGSHFNRDNTIYNSDIS